MKSYDVAVIVPLSEEFDHVKRIYDVERSFIHDKITFYELTPSEIAPGHPDIDIVATVLNEMGNANAAQKTERVLKSIEPPGPDLVALVGIAGRLDDDLRLGDVVVADQVTNYEVRSKIADLSPKQDQPEYETSDGKQSDGEDRNDSESDDQHEPLDRVDLQLPLVDWRPGGHTRRIAMEVTEAVGRFRNTETHYGSWQEQTSNQVQEWVETQVTEEERQAELTEEVYDPPPVAHKSHLASGGLVVASSEFSEQLAEQNRNFTAVEMEAAGVLLAVKRTDGVNGLIIRGISDLADAKKSSLDSMGSGVWRQCATYSAIQYLSHFLAGGFLDAASPTVSRTQGRDSAVKSTRDRRLAPDSTDHEGLTVESISIDAGGSATSFVRQHTLDSPERIGLESEERGVSLTAQLDIEVPSPVTLVAISITSERLDREGVLTQQTMINGTQRSTMAGSQTHLERPVELPAGEPVPIRLEKRYQVDSPQSTGVSSEDYIPVKISMEFKVDSGDTTTTFVCAGRIDETAGLVIPSIERDE
jgi:nucleoside phosphorylase